MLGIKKAGRRLIIIPPSLAYGSKEVPNRVPANSTLIFEVELRRVMTPEQFSTFTFICFFFSIFLFKVDYILGGMLYIEEFIEIVL